MSEQLPLLVVATSKRPRQPCARCGRRFRPTSQSQQLGPVCAMRARSVAIAIVAGPANLKRLSVSDTTTRGSQCEREACTNAATLRLGANGAWHLCEFCAVRAEFQRYKIRVPLKGVANA